MIKTIPKSNHRSVSGQVRNDKICVSSFAIMATKYSRISFSIVLLYSKNYEDIKEQSSSSGSHDHWNPFVQHGKRASETTAWFSQIVSLNISGIRASSPIDLWFCEISFIAYFSTVFWEMNDDASTILLGIFFSLQFRSFRFFSGFPTCKQKSFSIPWSPLKINLGIWWGTFTESGHFQNWLSIIAP